MLSHLLRHPSHLCPHLVYNTIAHVPFPAIRDAGFTHVVFDKDNTLTDHDSSLVRPDLLPALEQVMAVFGEDKVAILSNNKKSTLQHRARLLDGGPFSKPFCSDRVAQTLNADPKKIVIVGDRLATDMTLGHLLGGLSVLVLPWNTEKEQAGLTAARLFENLVWRKFLGQRLAPHTNEVIKKLQVSAPFS